MRKQEEAEEEDVSLIRSGRVRDRGGEDTLEGTNRQRCKIQDNGDKE